jgi:putative addiction module CopG family antidote
MARINPIDLPDELARFAEGQVASGRFASVADVLRAGVEELQAQTFRARELRAAWDDGAESLRVHGPQLESDEDFAAFLDDCEASALHQ